MAAKTQKKKPTVAKKTPAAPLSATPAAKAAQSTVTAFKALPKTDFFKEMTMINGNKQFDKITQGASAAGQEQMDAVMKSSAIFQKGMEEIIKVATSIAQEAGEQQAAATKTLFSCKTLNEFTTVQSKLAQSSFDNFMSNATKLTELSVKVCTDCFAPINDQVGKAVKKASSAAA